MQVTDQGCSVKLFHFSSLLLLIALTFILVPLGNLSFPTMAFAKNYLINPATNNDWTNGEFWLDFEINSGQVLRKSSNLKVQGDAIKFDTWVNYHCSDGDDLVLAILSATNANWGERRTSFNGNKTQSHLRHEMYYGVPFTTKSALQNTCRSGGSSVDEEYKMAVMCVDILKDPRLDRKRITAKVNCIDERPSTVVERVKLSCPAGYWVERTTKQEFTFEFDPARPPVLDNMCVPQGTYSGGKACPFIYTQNKPDGEWLAQGTILTDQNGKKTERTQVKDLKDFSGKVLIREIDPETSFIDAMSVILFYSDGSQKELMPEPDALKVIDGNYLTTKQGDQVEVSFEEPADWNFERAAITAHGFYEPY
ncbi:MAG: hypothetical protein KKB30_04420 [Proteobacteria bacterium]|nr:hypothetical protein [Pseudomonadota bacterium]MBU1716473.1 hypothetical protein [Pseudomonadota bacterium]